MKDLADVNSDNDGFTTVVKNARRWKQPPRHFRYNDETPSVRTRVCLHNNIQSKQDIIEPPRITSC